MNGSESVLFFFVSLYLFVPPSYMGNDNSTHFISILLNFKLIHTDTYTKRSERVVSYTRIQARVVDKICTISIKHSNNKTVYCSHCNFVGVVVLMCRFTQRSMHSEIAWLIRWTDIFNNFNFFTISLCKSGFSHSKQNDRIVSSFDQIVITLRLNKFLKTFSIPTNGFNYLKPTTNSKNLHQFEENQTKKYFSRILKFHRIE